MRELFRTDEGMAAWRNPATDAQSRRLLGALVQPQPESHLKLVLGGEGEILLDSLLRRGWVAWRELSPDGPDGSEPPTSSQEGHSSDQQAQGVSSSSPSSQAPPGASPKETGATPPARPGCARAGRPSESLHPGVHLPPVKVPPPASKEEIDSSLDEFFRKIGM